MKKLYLFYMCVCLLLSNIAVAGHKSINHDNFALPMNKIMFSIGAEQWIVSNKAKVEVAIDASLNQSGTDQLQTKVKQSLGKLSDSKWHITNYLRNQDQSGLEKVNMQAEAYLTNVELNNIRAKAKDMSKPGLKYSVINISYTPTLFEIETVREQLRDLIYKQVKLELAKINKMYVGQKFHVHKIRFFYGDIPAPLKQSGSSRMLMAKGVMAPGPATAMAVSQKQKLSALVVLAESNH